MTRTSQFLATALTAIVLMGAGCGGSSTANKPAAGPDGGIFSSKDSGVTWKQLKVLNLGEKQASIADMGIVTLANDPQDPQAIYAGTVQNGVIYSLDGGASWQNASGLNAGRVNAIAIHPKDKCLIFAARNNQIMKTENCSRDWSQVFIDPRADKQFTSIVIDWYNPGVMYAGTSDGDILKSQNSGEAWSVLKRIDGAKITQLLMNPKDSREMYILVERYGVLKMTESGKTFKEIRKEFDGFDGAKHGIAMAFDKNATNRVYHLSKFGLLRSDDGGATWSALGLPTTTGEVEYKTLVIHPKDGKKLFIGTAKTLLTSTDEGASWASKQPPTSRIVSSLFFSVAADVTTLYMGTLPMPK